MRRIGGREGKGEGKGKERWTRKEREEGREEVRPRRGTWQDGFKYLSPVISLIDGYYSRPDGSSTVRLLSTVQ